MGFGVHTLSPTVALGARWFQGSAGQVPTKYGRIHTRRPYAPRKDTIDANAQ